MIKTLFCFLLTIAVLSGSVFAQVTEPNYFREGIYDDSYNLIETSTPVTGVNLLGVVCGDGSCSTINSYLWGGNELYSSGDRYNVVYPTNLLSSYGYGIYVYKEGFIPYEIESDWRGTGTVRARNDYLIKKENCLSEIVDFGAEVSDDVLNVDVTVRSPIESHYDLMFMPPILVDYHRTRVDVLLEVFNSSSGDIVYSYTRRADPEFSGVESVSFSENLGDGEYRLVISSSVENEDKCIGKGVDSEVVSFSVECTDCDGDGRDRDEDCDDNDASVWQNLSGYLDSDLDSYGVDPQLDVCSGASLPVGYSNNNADCDDSDSSVWRILAGYVDADGDNYGVGPIAAVCSGSSLPFPYIPANGDCDDDNFDVNPGVLEVCDDGIDNNCDGVVDEGCDFFPSVVASGSPLSGVFPLDVSFSCQGSGGNGALEYFWDFGNGDTSIEQNPQYTYLESGSFQASCGVRDVDGDEAYDYVDVEVARRELEIVDFVCFDQVVEGNNQSCSVYVEDSSGGEVGGADVEIFYSDGSSFGSCLSDSISGACGVKDLQEIVGNFEVYAAVSKTGFIPDNDNDSRFQYEVLEERYTILGLSVYNDSGFLNEDYDFFRGEDLFVRFSVEDSDGVVYDELVSNVSLVSSLVGGRVALEKIEVVDGVYYYRLIPIPTTHEFFGDSNVFAFVFDFDNATGGQEEVSLMIRNNLPVISPVIGDESVREDESFSLNLSLYESDVEDSGDDLRWEVVSFGSDLGVNLVGKNLFVEGLSRGSGDVVLRLFDLDGDYDEQSFSVDVDRKSGGSSGGSSCRVDWECSAWSSCEDGVEIRDCFDAGDCEDNGNRPVQVRECFSGDVVLSSGGIVELGGFSAGEDEVSLIRWIVVGILFLLSLIILVLILFLLRK